MLTSEQVIEIFQKAGAMKSGHFQLTSGLHSGVFIEKFAVLQRPEIAARLCQELADRFKNDQVELVIGPTTGGLIISYEVAKALGVRSIFAEREGDKRVLKRGFKIEEGERVLVVDDVITTGGTIRDVMELVRSHKGKVIGVGMLVDRTGGTLNFGVKTQWLLSLKMEAYPPQNCPYCKEKVPLEVT